MALCCLPFLLSSCAASKRLKQLNFHSDTLSQAAASNATADQKVDALGTSFAQMMSEALSITNPKKGVDYVKKYADQNESSLNSIFKSLESSQKNMNTIEKVNYATSLLKKPYANDLLDLVPKFERKFKQVAFVAKLASKMKLGIGGALFGGLGKSLLLGNEPTPEPIPLPEPCPEP